MNMVKGDLQVIYQVANSEATTGLDSVFNYIFERVIQDVEQPKLKDVYEKTSGKNLPN